MPNQIGIRNCGCAIPDHDEMMDVKAVVDNLIATLDENEADVQKIAETAHKILKATDSRISMRNQTAISHKWESYH